MIPIGYLIASDDYEASKFALETLKAENGTLQTQIGQFEIAHENLVKQRDAVMKERDEANEALAKAVVVNRELSAQLQKAPLTRKPTITRDDLRNVAGVTIENGLVAPDEAQYERVRLNLMLIAGMGFNTARWFMGPGEAKKHLTLSETSLAHLPAFARSIGITYGADTVDRVVWDTLKIEDDPKVDAKVKALAATELKAYLETLAKWAAFFYFNDANQYPLTGFPAITWERMVERIRSITPNVPLVASVTANVDIPTYKRQANDAPDVAKRKFDHIEAQTFGKVSEFETFLARKFDVFCIDGRKSVTKTYLQQITPLFLQANPRAFFFYPTTVTDWLGMPTQMSVIREMISKWWRQGRS